MRRNIFTLALIVLTLTFATTAFAGANFQLSSYTLTSLGNYQLQFRGRSWNANNLNEITGIHVYIGGGVGAGGQMIGEFRTDQSHNFNATLTVPQNRSGNQIVVIYAVNGIESKELDRRYVNILSNNRKADFRLDSYDLTSPGNYQLRFRGRSWNESNRSEITGIHVYIGGGVGAGGQMIGEFRTDQSHNFDATLNTQNRNGNQLVVIYAVNGVESKELDRRNINILPNNQPSGDYDSKVQSFINDSRFRNGTSWTAGKTPTISGAGNGSGCNAYARDFIKYVYSTTLYGNGCTEFYSANEIKTGDVIWFANKYGQDSHWFVVLYRNGDNLTTAEGNWNGVVVVGDYHYRIYDGRLQRRNHKNENYAELNRSRAFYRGYHFR